MAIIDKLNQQKISEDEVFCKGNDILHDYKLLCWSVLSKVFRHGAYKNVFEEDGIKHYYVSPEFFIHEDFCIGYRPSIIVPPVNSSKIDLRITMIEPAIDGDSLNIEVSIPYEWFNKTDKEIDEEIHTLNYPEYTDRTKHLKHGMYASFVW